MSRVYLEATCGHEFESDLDVPPAETTCPEHGLVGLWAQRLEPITSSPRSLPDPSQSTSDSQGGVG